MCLPQFYSISRIDILDALVITETDFLWIAQQIVFNGINSSVQVLGQGAIGIVAIFFRLVRAIDEIRCIVITQTAGIIGYRCALIAVVADFLVVDESVLLGVKHTASLEGEDVAVPVIADLLAIVVLGKDEGGGIA